MARGVVTRERVERGITKITRTFADGRSVETFQIRYGDGSGQMLSDTFTTKAKARAALARARTQVMDGDHINPGSGDTKFLEVAREWILSHPDWKQRTKEANEWTVETKLVALHGKRIKQVTTGFLLTFRAELLSTPTLRGAPPATSSVKRTMGVLYAICEHARLKGHLAVNPCSDLPAMRFIEREVNVPTIAQVQGLIGRLGSPAPDDRPSAHDPRWPLLVEVAAWTGLRAGELAGLKKADLDFDAGTLSVRRAIVDARGGLREETPKTATSRRTIHLGEQLVRRLRDHTRHFKAGDYVFGVGGKPLRHNQFQGRVFRSAAGGLGLSITFHDLRHFHASVLIADTWSLLEVSRRLGHADASITAKRYAHLFRLRESNDGERIDSLRDRTGSGDPKRRKMRSMPF